MITREVDYAIRALLRLALAPDGKVVSATAVAEEMDIPYRFLRRILLRLTDAGYIASVRGRQGGVRLTTAPEQISLLDIVRAVDSTIITLNLCLADPEACSRTQYCVVHDTLIDIQQELNRRFADISLATLVARERERRERITP